MCRARFFGIAFGVSVSMACSALLATQEGNEKIRTAEETPIAGPALAQVEIVEVAQTSWQAVADRCRSDETLAPETPGRLMTLRAGEETYRIFLVAGRAIQCKEAEVTREKEAAAELDPELRASLETARLDLAGRLSIDVAQVEVAKAERVRWRDSSAGCPEPDRVYMQVLTEGARFVLAAAGREYHYHQVRGAPPFFCESPSQIEPLPGLEIQ
jgi:hypothetical protein